MRLGNITGECVTGENYNTARKTKMLVIKKVIDSTKKMVVSIEIGNYYTIKNSLYVSMKSNTYLMQGILK